MKNSTFQLISWLIGIGMGLAVFGFGLPLWTLLFFIPAATYLQIYASQQFSFRNSIRFEPIPEKGYEKRISQLIAHEDELESLGFTKFDEFYLRTSTDVVVYAYTHRELPVILCRYHHGVFQTYDLDTHFSNAFTLTTANTKYSNLGELRPAHLLLQSFPELPLQMLFQKHVESLKFLEEKGFAARIMPIYKFRDEFLREFLDSGRSMKGLLSPLKVVYLMYFGNKARFTKSIQEQFLADQLRLP